VIKPTTRTLDVCIVAVYAGAALACGTQASGDPDTTATTTGRPPVAVSVTPVQIVTMTDAVDVVGSLAPKFFADVKSEVSGTVTDVFVTDWVAVHTGAPLARLDTSETEAALGALKAGEAQARVFQTRAARERDRAIQLREYGLITDQALDDANTAFEAAAAATEAARAQIRTGEARLAKSFIKAPMDGVVAARHINVGDRVENMGGGDAMFRLVDNRVLDLTVTVPSTRLALIHVGQPLTFTADQFPARTFSGTVTFVNPAVDETSRAAKVIATVQNADGALRGGLFVRGRIVVSSRPDVLQVPREALLNWNVAARSADVFVVTGGQADKRRVRTGAVSGGQVEIVDALSAGEAVVTRGGFALRAGDRVTAAKPDSATSPARAGA
jgi:membrane fusion protein, multidrug efflux system